MGAHYREIITQMKIQDPQWRFPHVYELWHILKVLSSEMDPAEIRLIRQIFIKGSVAEVF